jgi:beta-glucosidase
MKENEQAAEIVAKMKLKDKATLVYGNGAWHTNGLPKFGVLPVSMQDGPCGLRKVDENPLPGASSYPATCFPAPCLTACSWDPLVTERIGSAEGDEAIDQNTNMVLAPGTNIKRNPLGGRNFEYLSEDPYLAGKMAAGFIRGLQSKGVACSLKHFALNEQETGRLVYSAEVDKRTLREIYLKPFEIAVKEASPWSVMCSYNRINGIYSCDNRVLLKNILREDWGFDGVVVTDWGAITHPVYSHDSGLDLEMPCSTKRAKIIAKAAAKGKISAKTLSDSAERMVTLSLRVHESKEQTKAFSYGISHVTALEAAERSMVLLKNDESLLPLKNYSGSCIIGELARTPRYQGAGSSQVNPKNLVNFLKAANAATEKGEDLPFAPGYSLGQEATDPKLKIEAVDLAASHANVLYFMGLPAAYESEGFDRVDLRLPENQVDLLRALYAVNKNIIVVLSGGGPVELPFLDEIKALLLAYLPGEAGGTAISNLLLGKTNPSGKLAETWPLHYQDVVSKDFFPGDGMLSLYKESLYVGYRYYLSAGKPVAFPFGYGLSYTSFKYSDLKISPAKLAYSGSFKLSCLVKNTGKVGGAEIVELYTSPLGGKVYKPLRELRDFEKVYLEPGEEKEVSFSLPFKAFSHYDETSERFEVEGGEYAVQVASSSEKIELEGDVTLVSSYEAIDRRSIIPSYYGLSKRGFRVSDSEFEVLLGHSFQANRLPLKPYTLNSTFGDIKNTFIGKKILKAADKPMSEMARSPEEKANLMKMVLEMPIRSVSMLGISDKKAIAVVDLANHRFVKALFHLRHGKRF